MINKIKCSERIDDLHKVFSNGINWDRFEFIYQNLGNTVDFCEKKKMSTYSNIGNIDDWNSYFEKQLDFDGINLEPLFEYLNKYFPGLIEKQGNKIFVRKIIANLKYNKSEQFDYFKNEYIILKSFEKE